MAQLSVAGARSSTTSPGTLRRCLQPRVSPGLQSKASQNLAWLTSKASVCIWRQIFAQWQLMPDRAAHNCAGILSKSGSGWQQGCCHLRSASWDWVFASEISKLQHSDQELWTCLLLLSDLRLKISKISISYMQCKEHNPANKIHEAKKIIPLNLHIYIIQLYFWDLQQLYWYPILHLNPRYK